MSKILSIIGPNKYQDVEYEGSKKVLESNGHEVVIASTQKDVVGKFGGHATVDLLLNEVKVDEFDAVIFIGGPAGHELFDNEEAHRIAKEFLDAGKVVSAICCAPSILANAGLMEGVKATCWKDQVDNLKAHGAIVVDEAVVSDGCIITGRDAEAATQFGQEIAELLANS